MERLHIEQEELQVVLARTNEEIVSILKSVAWDNRRGEVLYYTPTCERRGPRGG